MNPDKQRIAIAEACGWKKSDLWAWDGQTCYEHAKHDPRTASQLPDYLNDLNAMHEAEKVLTEAQKVEYARHIFCAEQQAHEESDETWHRCVFATAAQRAEAFLKAIGKWEEV